MKSIEVKNDLLKQCPKCSGHLEYQNEWEQSFNKYNQKHRSFYDVLNQIHHDNQPKYICNQCDTKILVIP